MGTKDDVDAELGRQIIATGALKDLRLELGLTQLMMTDLLGINPITYRRWENYPDTRLWTMTAAKVGRFYRSARSQIELLSDHGVTLSELEPYHQVAMKAGMTQEGLLHMYRSGRVSGVELGVLGMWMERSKVKEVGRA